MNAPIKRLAGVCGWPVHHSLSPFLHNTWLKAKGLNDSYTMFAVHPDEAIYAFQSLKHIKIAGLNITLPLKGKAYEAAENVTPDARKIGVCNLLYVRKDTLVGDNTDMEGFTVPLLQNVSHNYLLNNTVTVIGAGGAARAALGALLSIGAPEIRIINRTDARAEILAGNINVPSLYALPWAVRHEAMVGTGLVVNTTSLGLKDMGLPDVDLSGMAENGWVYDLVYNPVRTRFLKSAAKLGLNTIDGLEMLIAQARPSFRRFYGKDPPEVENLKGRLISHMKVLK